MRDLGPLAAAQGAGAGMRLRLLTGAAALEHAGDAACQAAWRTLYVRCPWAGACQHPDFVLTWYRHYQPGVLPVLVLAQAADGALGGLLALALRDGSRVLRGAGEQQAEYQAWLAPPDDGDAFIVAAVRALRDAFPATDLSLRYLPPGTPLDWLQDGDELGLLATLRPHACPVMRVEQAAMARQRNKKNQRQNFNRLSRIGEVRLERVRDHDRFAALFGDLCMQYDFRQAALYRQMPFAEDAAKKAFHLALHRQGLLHATVLTVGGEPAAAHIGLLSEGRALHIGILTHSPFHATHSPGTLLLAMLGVELAGEGVPLLDLTPGGDGYKEGFATGHERVHELTIHACAARRLAAQAGAGLKEAARAMLKKGGMRGADLAAALDGLRHGGPSCWLRRLRARPCSLRYAGRTASAGAGGLVLSRNRLADLFRFDPSGAAASRWNFMGTAMRRLDRGHELYTLAQDGRLLLSCWVQLDADGAPVLSGLHLDRRRAGTALLRAFLSQLLAQLAGARPGAPVFYRGRLAPGLRRTFEDCGFVADGGAPVQPIA